MCIRDRTGLDVVIEDRHGNVRAAVPDVQDHEKPDRPSSPPCTVVSNAAAGPCATVIGSSRCRGRATT